MFPAFLLAAGGWAGVVRLGLILALVTTVIGAMHWYNEGLIEEGRAEVALEWAEKNEEANKQREAARVRLEKEKADVAKKYFAERAIREQLQRRLEDEIENAIKASAIAATACIDERMRDDWDAASGHSPTGKSGKARGSVAPTVR